MPKSSNFIIKFGASAIARDDVATTLASPHFQQLWLGAECLWVGDLVRLRSWGSAPLGILETSPRAEERSLFLRLDTITQQTDAEALTIARQSNPNAEPIKLAMCSGKLYELQESSNFSPLKGAFAQATSSSALSSSILVKESNVMPSSPEGYIFRCITPEGESVLMGLGAIAGRYYPLPEDLRTRVEEIRRPILNRQAAAALAQVELVKSLAMQTNGVASMEVDRALEDADDDGFGPDPDVATRQCLLAGLLTGIKHGFVSLTALESRFGAN